VVIPSAIIVIVLGVLQYRWSTSVSESTAVRLADSLQMSMMNWQKDFFRYFSEIGLALRIDPVDDAGGNIDQYVRRFAEWQATAKYPELVSDVYVLRQQRALRLNSQTRQFEPSDWPAQFESLRTASSKRGWLFDPNIPALVHSMIPTSSRQDVDWIAIKLNRHEIETKILSDLSRIYFQGTDGLDYLVAIVRPGHVMYSSDPGFGDPEPADADGTIDIFGRVYDPSLGSPVHVFHMPSDNKGPEPSVKIAWFPLLDDAPASLDWRMVVRHRRGGALGAFVKEMRRRDLAIGFGALLVLVVNMGMLVVTSHRAQRLAQLQMNFVTAVSHELRTPLTVIISGADNIRSGVVETKEQLMQYGSVIGNQARQLFGLVERILLFAATRQGHQRYNLRSLDVQEAIEAALANAAGLIEAGHFTVEREIEPSIPKVIADASALSQCLQNLITNALKYGAEQRWLGIRAKAGENGSASREIQISVSDRGIGISAADLAHIFEPFYRSPAVRDAQIHGTGLGLPLSQNLAEAMDGRLTVTSAPGRGSTFTLHLPCAHSTIERMAERGGFEPPEQI
jgi:signal transduction histidine kinase